MIVLTLLNHLMGQNSWANRLLCPHAGKVLHLHLPPLNLQWRITPSGDFCAAQASDTPNATISTSLGAALTSRITHNTQQFRLTGDTAFAAAVGRVLQNLHWDIEADLSRVTGDIAAHEIQQAGQRFIQQLQQQARAWTQMCLDYWIEEQPAIASSDRVRQFADAVDTLRDEVAQLTRRLQKLEQHCQTRSV